MRIQIPPTVSLVNGAEYNASTGELKFLLLLHFFRMYLQGIIDSGVLAEDSVTGTTSGFNQSNVYSGGMAQWVGMKICQIRFQLP